MIARNSQSLSWWKKRWVRNSALGILFLLFLYTLVGFLIAPYILKKQLVSYLENNLGVAASIKDVAINPYTLALRITGFSMRQQGEPKLVSFKQLYANLAPASSLARKAWVFKEIRLLRPYLFIKINKNGQLNLAKLMPQKKASPPKKDKEWVPVISDQVSIEKGHIHFVDKAWRTPIKENLEGIDLDLKEFSTLPERGGSYAFKATLFPGTRFRWKGDITLNPFHSKGHFSVRRVQVPMLWQYLRNQGDPKAQSGRIDVSVDYRLKTRADTLQLTLNNILFALSQLKLKSAEGNREVLTVPKLGLSGGQVHWPEKIVGVEQIVMVGTELYAWRNEQGVLNWQEWLAVKNKTREEKKPASTANNSSPHWQVAVKKINIEDVAAHFQDKTTEPPVSIGISNLDLQLTDITSIPRFKSHFNLKFDVNGQGQASGQGTFSVAPRSFNAKVHVAQFPLPPFQPYLSRFVKLKLTSGNLEIDGKVNYAKSNNSPHLQFRGNLALRQFSTEDALMGERLLAWDALKANQIWLELFPSRFQINTIELKAPQGKIVINEKGKSNIKEVLSSFTEKKQETPSTAESAPIPIAINVIYLKDGAVNFTDLSVPSKTSIGVHALHGSIKNLSSQAQERASASLEGTIQSYGLARIKGTAALFALRQNSVFGAVFQNIKLPKLTPYAVKFVGYTIEKGSLSLDLDYQIREGHLQGINEIIINNLTLGKRVENPEAIKAPIKLAVALLKNPQGEIYIKLPVEGNTSSLHFSYGHIIAKAMTGFIGEVVSSPFRLLAKLAGAKEEILKFVEFRPGSSELSPPTQEKLLQLAGALKKRPELQLQIQGRYDPVADIQFFKQKQFEALLSAQLKQAIGSGGEALPASQQALKLEILEQLYSKEFSAQALEQARAQHRRQPAEMGGKGTNKQKPTESGTSSVEEESSSYQTFLRERLIAAQSVSKDKLRQLGQARAITIKEFLVQQGGIEGRRIEVLPSKSVEESGEGLIRLQLQLSSR